MEMMPTSKAHPSVVVIGFTCRDTNILSDGTEHAQVGGKAYYTGLALKALGVVPHVITWVAEADRELLDPYRNAGITVTNLPVERTIEYRNHYSDIEGNNREQRVSPSPFTLDLKRFPAGAREAVRNASMIYFGTDLADVVNAMFLKELRTTSLAQFAVDFGTFTRSATPEGAIAYMPTWPSDVPHDVFHTAVLSMEDTPRKEKRSSPEDVARILTKYGIEEVLVTLGSHGSMFHSGTLRSPEAITPFPADAVDPTGAGDTFIAAYLAERLHSDDLVRCARFASAAAAASIQHQGPLTTSRGEILQVLGEGVL